MRNDGWIRKSVVEIEIEFVMQRCSIIQTLELISRFLHYAGTRVHASILRWFGISGAQVRL